MCIEQTGHSPFKINDVQLLDVKKAHYSLTFNEGATVQEITKALEVFRETATELNIKHFNQMAERIALNLQVVGEPFSMLEWEFKVYSGNACVKVMKITGNSAWDLNKLKANLTVAVGGAQAQYSPPIEYYQEKVKYGSRPFGFIGPRKFYWNPFQRTRALDMGHIDQLRKALEAKISDIQERIEKTH